MFEQSIIDQRRNFPEMQCFVLMPFGSRNEYGRGHREADFIYRKIIIPALERALSIQANDSTVVREVDNGESELIAKSIIQRIFEALFVIADVTGHNANVFFELGVRYSLRRAQAMLIKQPDVEIPFDLRNYRHHIYELLDDGAAYKLADAIKANIGAMTDRVDSPVFDVFPALEVRINQPHGLRMPWGEFSNRLDLIREKIIDSITDGSYIPDAVIGITKGGAMFADLLTQRMPSFKGPTLSLWANRDSENHEYFKNSINQNMLKGLIDYCGKQSSDLRIILVDEVIASGTTYHQAVNIITSMIPGCHLRYIPMVYRESKTYEGMGNRILWRHQAFQLAHEEINQIHAVDWIELPWGKDIRRS